jgi:hypothetical protein
MATGLNFGSLGAAQRDAQNRKATLMWLLRSCHLMAKHNWALGNYAVCQSEWQQLEAIVGRHVSLVVINQIPTKTRTCDARVQYCPVNLKGVGQKANSRAAFRVTRRVSDLNGK